MTSPNLNHDVEGTRQVTAAYDETQRQLASIRSRFDAAVAGITGVQSGAAMAMKSAVATEVVPRFNAIVQQFASLGTGIGLANRDAVQANEQATDSVASFRSKLNY
ncbi:hypothetical protein O7632_13260 [Solwaraspora sp. WMMD406]|uniref:hypothetical protein n=1 Tax=Solwaraspora sp. WMMD406 TaxID=3016095 RepID=UPI00241631FC|nr:hypothetical protein [Solwaraspora sp. WMMD406]MDG4765059.1 hypothetical protein [Solwaraspora sp. WMMD406]